MENKQQGHSDWAVAAPCPTHLARGQHLTYHLGNGLFVLSHDFPRRKKKKKRGERALILGNAPPAVLATICPTGGPVGPCPVTTAAPQEHRDKAQMLGLQHRCWGYTPDVGATLQMLELHHRCWRYTPDVGAASQMLGLYHRYLGYTRDVGAAPQILGLHPRCWGYTLDIGAASGQTPPCPWGWHSSRGFISAAKNEQT